jgi:hypothetical protein
MLINVGGGVEAQSRRWIYRGSDLFAQRAGKLGNRRKEVVQRKYIVKAGSTRRATEECETDANQGDTQYRNRLQAPCDDEHDGASHRRA